LHAASGASPGGAALCEPRVDGEGGIAIVDGASVILKLEFGGGSVGVQRQVDVDVILVNDNRLRVPLYRLVVAAGREGIVAARLEVVELLQKAVRGGRCADNVSRAMRR
jgi:hypothetical protein